MLDCLLTLIAPTNPSILALPASALYATVKKALAISAPGRRVAERARSVCVHNVKLGRIIARNLKFVMLAFFSLLR
jgi:hypothetical protein